MICDMDFSGSISSLFSFMLNFFFVSGILFQNLYISHTFFGGISILKPSFMHFWSSQIPFRSAIRLKINVLFNVFIMFLEFFARLACSKQNNFLRNVFITFYLHWAIFLTGIPIQPIFPFFLYGFGLKLQDDFMLLDRYFLYQIVE